MKCCLLLIIISGLYTISYGQTNTFPTSGNVGIGTANPIETLEVNGNIRVAPGSNYLRLGGGTQGVGGYLQGSSEAGYTAGYGLWVNHNAYWNGTNWIQPRGTLSSSLYSSNYHLDFIWEHAIAGGVNNGIIVPKELMKLNSSGRLGIGTGSVISARLHVNGVTEQLRLGYNDSNYNKFITGANGNMTISAHGTNPNITLTPGGTGNVLLNGNVGIGTVTPDSKLTVAGNIHSKEVKVSVNAGADFVFDEDYKLPDLESIDKYVKVNGHLQDIPSAKEMKINGLEIGGFQIKLLQKIEELTLHLIEAKKENKRERLKLQEIIEQQQEDIKSLKSRMGM